MFAILAEAVSDAEALEHFVRRRLGFGCPKIKKKGYDGCGGLCNKGARDIKLFANRGVNRFIICHDADRRLPKDIRKKIIDEVITPSQFQGPTCIAIPVEEIEAWLIADELAIKSVIPTFNFKGHPKPESIKDPKEWLCKESRACNGKPLYSPATFNPAVAKMLNFKVVSEKCPSFRAFLDWLDNPVPAS